MKILVISAHHPPCHFGGYELRVKDIMDGLAARGHSIRVLTNSPEKKTRAKELAQAYPVIRKLHDRRKAGFFPREVLFDLLDTRLLQRQIDRFKPDVIYLGHTYILSKALLPYLARQAIPIVYDEGGSGLIEAWTEHGRWFRFTCNYRSRFAILNAIKPLVIRTVCALSRGRITPLWTWPENIVTFFNSKLNYFNAAHAGVPLNEPAVIHSGIDTGRFTFKTRTKLATPLRILVPGRIERRKGQMDALILLDQLLREDIESHLVLAGGKWVDGYYEEVIDTIKSQKLMDRVHFHPMLTTEALINEYHEADICFFPSKFRTGFSRVPLEAMACGSIVISYGNEGSDEIIENGFNGFIIKDQDFHEIRQILSLLIHSSDRITAITDNARNTVEANNGMNLYIDHIEAKLIKTAGYLQ